MSRLYFGMDSNLKPSKADYPTPYIDYIAFENAKENKIISVSCCGDSCWGIDEDNVLSGRWKDLEVCLEEMDDDSTRIHDYEDMEESEFDLLINGSVPYEIGLYFPEPSEYDERFRPELKNIDINIQWGEREHTIKVDKIDIIEYGD